MFAIQVELGFGDGDTIFSAGPRRVAHFEPPPAVVKTKPIELPTDDAVKVAAKPSHQPDKPLTAKKVGLFDALEGLKGVDALFKPGNFGPGLQAALDKLGGDQRVGEMNGVTLGPRGGAPFNGNDLGLGRDGMIGRPSGPGGNLGRKTEPMGPCCADTKVSDGLSKDLIAKVIRRHASEVKYCYEQTLQQKPDLAGKFAVLFVIDAAGAVAEADVAESTLDDAAVEACVLARVRRWKFPEPQGGGIVSVNHPWFFKPAGSEE